MKKLSSWVAVLSILTGLAFTSQAHADDKFPCVVTSLQHDSNRLVVSCEADTKLYYALQNAAAPCASISADNMKIFAGMLQTAMLSGMPVQFWYAPAITGCNIAQIQMVKVHKQ